MLIYRAIPKLQVNYIVRITILHLPERTIISAEYEQRIELGKKSPSIGHTLGSFKDSNKTVNFTLAVPIK